MEKFEEKMKAAGLSEAAIGAFRLNYEQLVAGVTGLVSLMDCIKIKLAERLKDSHIIHQRHPPLREECCPADAREGHRGGFRAATLERLGGF